MTLDPQSSINHFESVISADTPQAPATFETSVTSLSQVPNVVFLAVSPEEKELWVNAINAAIIRAKNRVLDEVGGPGTVLVMSVGRVLVLSQWSLFSRWSCKTTAGCFIPPETESRSLKVAAFLPGVTCWPW